MDDKQPRKQTDEESNGSVDIADDIKKAYAYIEIIQNKLSGYKNAPDGAGPSTSVLPGAVHKPMPKPGQSKSEHSIRHVITTNDVANALKLTSLSFSPLQLEDNMNFKDVKLPLGLKETLNNGPKEDFKTFADIKDLMVACIKKQGLNLADVSNVQSINTGVSNILLTPVHDPTVNANVVASSKEQTDKAPPITLKANEVLLTGNSFTP